MQKMLPRHYEIMRRLSLGEQQTNIAADLGMTDSRMSIIVNAPLFQLEYHKMLRRQEDRIALIHEKIIVGAEQSIELHNQIIKGEMTIKDSDGSDVVVTLPLNTRQQSATAIANLFLKLTKGAPLDPSEEGEEGYESKLEREVTFRETTTTKRKKVTKEGVEAALAATHPSDDALAAADSDALDAMVEAEVCNA